MSSPEGFICLCFLFFPFRLHQVDLSEDEVDELSSPYEAILRPGDVLWFPSKWPHYTEAIPPAKGEVVLPSISLGFRCDGILLL